MHIAESLPQASGSRTHPVAALGLALVIMLASIGVLHMTGGPVSETAGVVKDVSKGRDGTATVQLANGMRVRAKIAAGFDPRPGDQVQLTVHEGTMAGTDSYEVAGPREQRK